MVAGLAGYFWGMLCFSSGRSKAACDCPLASISTTPVRNAAARKIKTVYVVDDLNKPPGLAILRCGWQHTKG